ncbi:MULTISPECIES: hypothetical protein [Bacteroides]|jgi:hypothetical protein|uniref:hypothetical protein n=2 Tax=Bacteroides TaxID=816 RepID=UPI00203033C5|nr:hypothetical protein [Bacteroides fragilis]MCE8596536.1 hypothetical protein [Bacteroides fragilis]MCE8610929.1 hypothetical protein [Bacteroides fragilis]MCE8622665.1 hypothetical protein [Bacteroides fragilis]MCE8652854.1 hypothetical protein [Bacteroides fragilis]MCM0274281.1 hypothetical protein [Bacteroides fragilis]
MWIAKIGFSDKKVLMRILFTICYVLLYQFIWVEYCCDNFDYYGFAMIEYDFYEYIPTLFMAICPILFYNGLLKISSIISIIIYVFCYIPIILSIFYMQNQNINNCVFFTQFLVFLGMVSFFLSDRLVIRNMEYCRRIKKYSFKSLLWITLAIIIILIILYSPYMRLVSLSDVYDLRENSANITGMGIVGYLVFWSSNAFVPFFFIYGLLKKKTLYVVLGFVCYVLLFMMTGQKTNFFMPLILYGFIVLLRYERKGLPFYLLLICSLVCISILVFNLSDDFMIIKAIVFMRTLCIPGLLFVNYLDFFLTHDLTYYTHVSIIQLFTGAYPYNEPLGYVIGDIYGGGNVNANFWTTDGIAAMLLPGILFINILFFIFLVFLNSITKKINRDFVFVLFIPSIVYLLNASFFTFLLSSGGIICILILLFFDIPLDEVN